MTRFVSGPARATNALLLVIAVGTAVALGGAAHQLPTVLVGLGAAGASLLALRAFARESAAGTVVGSALALLAAVGVGALLIFTPVLAYEAYKDEPAVAIVAMTTALSTLTPWLTVGAVVCVLSVTTDGLDRGAVQTYLGSVLTSLVVVSAGLLAVLSQRAGVLAVGPFVTAVVETARRIETHSQLTELGALAVLLALVAGLAVAVSSLPRYRWARMRLRTWLRSRWSVVADVLDEARDDAAGPETDGDGDSESETDESATNADGGTIGAGEGTTGTGEGRIGADETPTHAEDDSEIGSTSRAENAAAGRRWLGHRSRVRRASMPVAVLLWVEGLVLLWIGAVQESGATVATTLPDRLGGLGEVLAAVATAGWLRAALAWVAVAFVLLGVGHAVLTKVIQVPWKRYRSRVLQAVVPALLVGAGIVLAPAIVDHVAETPSLHYVSVALPDGQTPRFTADGIALVDAPAGASGLYRSSEGFLLMLRFAVDLVGTAPLVLGPVFGLLFLGTWTILAGQYGARPVITRFTSVPVLAGWFLFGSALAAAVLGVGAPLVLLAGVGAILTWDLQGVSRRLAAQLDPAAKTIRGELIRVGGTGVALSFGAALAVGGMQVSQSLAAVDARPSWQLLAVQVFSVVGTAVALAYLSYQRD